jgi:hypothetical protein
MQDKTAEVRGAEMSGIVGHFEQGGGTEFKKDADSLQPEWARVGHRVLVWWQKCPCQTRQETNNADIQARSGHHALQ